MIPVLAAANNDPIVPSVPAIRNSPRAPMPEEGRPRASFGDHETGNGNSSITQAVHDHLADVSLAEIEGIAGSRVVQFHDRHTELLRRELEQHRNWSSW